MPTVGGAATAFFEMAPMPHLDPFWVKYLPPWVRMRNIVVDGPVDQRETPEILGARAPYPRLADRPDVLVFRTGSLQNDLEVTGPITVHLWVSSSATDTDFTAKLIDELREDGFAMNLVDSIFRVRYREGWDHEVFMQPGTVYPITLQLPPTSNLFARGHRIRLDISSSNFPRFDVNPNTGEPVGRHTRMQVANNTIHCGESRIVLPVIP